MNIPMDLVGKTIIGVEYKEEDNYEILDIYFKDETVLRIKSWDFEDYQSGLTISKQLVKK